MRMGNGCLFVFNTTSQWVVIHPLNWPGVYGKMMNIISILPLSRDAFDRQDLLVTYESRRQPNDWARYTDCARAYFALVFEGIVFN